MDERERCLRFMKGGSGNCRLQENPRGGRPYLPMCRIAEGDDPDGCPEFVDIDEDADDI